MDDEKDLISLRCTHCAIGKLIDLRAESGSLEDSDLEVAQRIIESVLDLASHAPDDIKQKFCTALMSMFGSGLIDVVSGAWKSEEQEKKRKQKPRRGKLDS